MKTNAIIRIVIFSLVILVLSSILVGGIALRDRGFDWVYRLHQGSEEASPTSAEHHENEENHDYTSSAQRTSGKIDELSIDWASGSITIQPGDTDEILYEETGDFDSANAMVAKVSGSKLTIQYCKDGSFLKGGFSFGGSLHKDLTITVPRDWVCRELEIDVASADLDIRDLTIHEFDFDGASGRCTLTNCAVGEMSLETASGDVTFSGTLDALDCDSASAKLQLELRNTPRSIDMDTASGSLTMVLPEDCGFTVSLDALSGRFSSDFATTTQNGHHIYGDGSCKINVSSMSGGVTIRKG